MSKITKRKYVEQEVMEFVLPSENQKIVKVTGGRGNNLHEVVDAQKNIFLASMPCKFRKNIWIKRGDFVIIDPIVEGDKVKGEIVHILFKEQISHIQEEGLWPEAFGQKETKPTHYIDEDLLPPSDSDDEDLAEKVVNANKGGQLYEHFSDDEEQEEESEAEEETEDCCQDGETAADSEETCQS